MKVNDNKLSAGRWDGGWTHRHRSYFFYSGTCDVVTAHYIKNIDLTFSKYNFIASTTAKHIESMRKL